MRVLRVSAPSYTVQHLSHSEYFRVNVVARTGLADPAETVPRRRNAITALLLHAARNHMIRISSIMAGLKSGKYVAVGSVCLERDSFFILDSAGI